jgi:hypothetical protein
MDRLEPDILIALRCFRRAPTFAFDGWLANEIRSRGLPVVLFAFYSPRLILYRRASQDTPVVR